METIIGGKVRIKTSLGEDVSGEIFSYDSATNCVVLVQESAHSTLKKSYRILKVNFVKEIEYFGKSESAEPDLELPLVNIARIRAKEASVLRNLRDEASRIGVGVSKEAQEIFNSLAKTLPCRWKDDSIVVFDEIIIKNPYQVSNCAGGDPVMLDRVKKVLEGERRRLMKNI